MQGCRLFKLCWSLPAGHCVAGVKGPIIRTGHFIADVKAVKGCPNLPSGHCVAGVQSV